MNEELYNPTLVLLSSIVTPAAVSAAIVWLCRSWISEKLKNAIKHEYDAKLETHKAQLNASNETQLERLKSELQAASQERQVQFSAVYAKREELLGRLHNAMTDVLLACLDSTKVGNRTLSPEAGAKFTVMKSLIDEAAIYFPEESCERWHERTFQLQQTLTAFLSARANETRDFAGDLARMKDAYEQHLTAYRTTRRELRQEIRGRLGTGHPTKNSISTA